MEQLTDETNKLQISERDDKKDKTESVSTIQTTSPSVPSVKTKCPENSNAPIVEEECSDDGVGDNDGDSDRPVRHQNNDGNECSVPKVVSAAAAACENNADVKPSMSVESQLQQIDDVTTEMAETAMCTTLAVAAQETGITSIEEDGLDTVSYNEGYGDIDTNISDDYDDIRASDMDEEEDEEGEEEEVEEDMEELEEREEDECESVDDEKEAEDAEEAVSLEKGVRTQSSEIGARRRVDRGDNSVDDVAAKKVDHDNDKRNPQYIPKKGNFYEHDNRTDGAAKSDSEIAGLAVAGGAATVSGASVTTAVAAAADTGTVAANEAETTATNPGAGVAATNSGGATISRKPAAYDRWNHDKYNETEQSPKTRAELVTKYGYDIRNEEGPPKSRRRRRYIRGQVKYNRNWADEEAYLKPIVKRRTFRASQAKTAAVGAKIGVEKTKKEGAAVLVDCEQATSAEAIATVTTSLAAAAFSAQTKRTRSREQKNVVIKSTTTATTTTTANTTTDEDNRPKSTEIAHKKNNESRRSVETYERKAHSGETTNQKRKVFYKNAASSAPAAGTSYSTNNARSRHSATDVASTINQNYPQYAYNRALRMRDHHHHHNNHHHHGVRLMTTATSSTSGRVPTLARSTSDGVSLPNRSHSHLHQQPQLQQQQQQQQQHAFRRLNTAAAAADNDYYEQPQHVHPTRRHTAFKKQSAHASHGHHNVASINTSDAKPVVKRYSTMRQKNPASDTLAITSRRMAANRDQSEASAYYYQQQQQQQQQQQPQHASNGSGRNQLSTVVFVLNQGNGGATGESVQKLHSASQPLSAAHFRNTTAEQQQQPSSSSLHYQQHQQQQHQQIFNRRTMPPQQISSQQTQPFLVNQTQSPYDYQPTAVAPQQFITSAAPNAVYNGPSPMYVPQPYATYYAATPPHQAAATTTPQSQPLYHQQHHKRAKNVIPIFQPPGTTQIVLTATSAATRPDTDHLYSTDSIPAASTVNLNQPQ